MVKRSKTSISGGSVIMAMFDKAMNEADQAHQARVNEEQNKKEVYIPMSLKGGPVRTHPEVILQWLRALLY